MVDKSAIVSSLTLVRVVALGTSSKSTKLVHGGVRYLQKAVFELDYEQYKLVKEALHERKIFLQTAPYLSNMLPIMLPLYKCVGRSRLFARRVDHVQVLAGPVLLDWMQDVRYAGGEREHGNFLSHDQRESTRGVPDAEK